MNTKSNSKSRIEALCAYCGKAFTFFKSSKRKYCSKECYWKHKPLTSKGKNNSFYGKQHTIKFKESRKREGNPAWKGGRYINKRGYVVVLDREHPYAYKDGYVPEHRKVWYDTYGEIPNNCDIHHINGNKLDNRIENLQLIEHGKHSSIEKTGNKYAQKYTDNVVLDWVNLHYKGMSYKKISKKVGVEISVVYRRCKKFTKKYPLPEWAVFQIFRESGLLEDICRDNYIGHPNKEWLKENDPYDKKGFRVHGCDGCCSL